MSVIVPQHTIHVLRRGPFPRGTPFQLLLPDRSSLSVENNNTYFIHTTLQHCTKPDTPQQIPEKASKKTKHRKSATALLYLSLC